MVAQLDLIDVELLFESEEFKKMPPAVQEEIRVLWEHEMWDRCAADPVFFVDKFGVSYDPRRPELYVRHKLFPKQVEHIRMLQWCDEEQVGSLTEKSRDSGASYDSCFYAIWCFIFGRGDSTGFGSLNFDAVDKLGDPDSLFEKMRIILRNLPSWMMQRGLPGFDWRTHSTKGKLINPKTGATIVGQCGDKIGRGGRKARYFVDEAAHLEHKKLVDAALVANTNCRHDQSTPNGLDEFYRKRQSKKVKVLRMHWSDDARKNSWEERRSDGKVVRSGVGRHPTKPTPRADLRPQVDKVDGLLLVYPWYEKEREKPEYIDTSIMAQEVDIDYIGTGAPRFNRRWLMEQYELLFPNGEYRHPPLRLPEDDPGFSGQVTTFKDPAIKHTYVVTADTAKGLTESGTADYSVAHVYDLETCEQVLHYRGQMVENEFALDLVTICTMYNNALLVVETPGPGEAVLSAIAALKTPYPYVYSYWDDDAAWGQYSGRYGLPMTQTTKPEGDGKLASMLFDAEQEIPASIKINHPNTFEELIHYVRIRGGICQAEAGGHDDSVSCCRLLAMIWAQYTTRGISKIGELPLQEPTTTGAQSIRRAI